MGKLFTNGLIWNSALVLVKLTLSGRRFLSYRNQSIDLLFILPLYTSWKYKKNSRLDRCCTEAYEAYDQQ